MKSSQRSRPDIAGVRRAVRRWASTVDRPLPWRGERDPYKVLVSEVMLQQTQASRVVEPYMRFLSRFPSVESLASADAADVLREWGSLGYNRRALNLWRAARAIVSLGGFPQRVEELQALPGIGPYTARAVATFAFGVHCGVVDANVRRVVSRAFGIESGAEIQATADSLAPRGNSASWNQTMIDLGALVCRARNPLCGSCPLSGSCRWAAGNGPLHQVIRCQADTQSPDATLFLSQSRPGVFRATQPPFDETSRYVRGRIVAELRANSGPVQRETLKRRVGVVIPRFEAALKGLEKDGLVYASNDAIALGAPVR